MSQKRKFDSTLERWLEAPGVATVKLDGTNVGVDGAGLLMGRNLAYDGGCAALAIHNDDDHDDDGYNDDDDGDDDDDDDDDGDDDDNDDDDDENDDDA